MVLSRYETQWNEARMDDYVSKSIVSRGNVTCPIAVAAEVLSDQWSVIIIRDIAFFHRRTFGSILANNNEKEYIVQVNRKITSEFISNMSKGVKLKNIKTKPCVIQKINNYTFKIILTQGLNRQIRRMCNLFDYKVKSLIRTRIMNIDLGSMKVGKFRKFFPNELQGLNKILEKSL